MVDDLATLVGALSTGERLWLQRRRDRRPGSTARRLRVHDVTLSRWITGGTRRYVRAPAEVTDAERLLVLRRRLQRARGWTTGDVARALGISRMTLCKWERAVEPRLVTFYRTLQPEEIG